MACYARGMQEAGEGIEKSKRLAAQDKVRMLIGGSQDIIVYFRDGTYIFDETVVLVPEGSGSADQQILYAAYPDEKPIFTSLIPVTGWSTFSENIMVRRFLPG